MKGKSALVAGLGDSRCVLGGASGKYRAVTADHTPASLGERERIESCGGEVSAFPDEPPPEVSGKGRLFVAGQMFPGLALSRAFGDLVAKSAGLSVVPDVESIELGGICPPTRQGQ